MHRRTLTREEEEADQFYSELQAANIKIGLLECELERASAGTDPCGWEKQAEPDGDHFWNTGCGRAFNFSAGDWRENSYRFCPGCGGKIIEVGEEPTK